MKHLAAFLILVAGHGVVSEQTVCPDGYEPFPDPPNPDVCLRFGKNPAEQTTFYEWRGKCLAEGADLARLEGDLHLEVINYIDNHPEMRDEGYWLGGSDDGHEGYWVWINDNTPMEMGPPHWNPDEPDGGTAENFLCLYTPDFFFSSCQNENIYGICRL